MPLSETAAGVFRNGPKSLVIPINPFGGGEDFLNRWNKLIYFFNTPVILNFTLLSKTSADMAKCPKCTTASLKTS